MALVSFDVLQKKECASKAEVGCNDKHVNLDGKLLRQRGMQSRGGLGTQRLRGEMKDQGVLKSSLR